MLNPVENVTVCFEEAARWRALMAWGPLILAGFCFAGTLTALTILVRRR